MTMAKFHVRRIKKRYLTKKVYDYRHYDLSLPSKLNKEIDPHQKKQFDITDFSHKDAVEKETINITLTRNKNTKQDKNQKS